MYFIQTYFQCYGKPLKSKFKIKNLHIFAILADNIHSPMINGVETLSKSIDEIWYLTITWVSLLKRSTCPWSSWISEPISGNDLSDEIPISGVTNCWIEDVWKIKKNKNKRKFIKTNKTGIPTIL